MFSSENHLSTLEQECMVQITKLTRVMFLTQNLRQEFICEDKRYPSVHKIICSIFRVLYIFIVYSELISVVCFMCF